jgi:ATP adenylyltransferase/5',5'''-P-1,P-4-tetraphosphate phosphorylase II
VAQCNPVREASASARVDAASLAARPCFLCQVNLPAEQERLAYRNDWLILCNPAPIFEPHFTISATTHTPQLLARSLEAMLGLARDLEGAYTVFYNGGRCGASAPDHLHLQATPAGVMPFETELAAQLCSSPHASTDHWLEWVATGPVHIGLSRPRRRPVVVFVGASQAEILAAVARVLEVIGEIHPDDPEPMVNAFATWAEGRWIVWLFPRKAHRPACYGTGPQDFLVSPGAVDLAGVLITPRGADFDRLTQEVIGAIYSEVLLSPGQFARLRDRLANEIRAG